MDSAPQMIVDAKRRSRMLIFFKRCPPNRTSPRRFGRAAPTLCFPRPRDSPLAG
jgi:hypothetical protein